MNFKIHISDYYDDMIICPSCETIINNSLLKEYFSDETLKTYYLYHCKNCDLQFWYPLEFVKSIYEEEKVRGYKQWHEGLNLNLTENHKAFIKILPQIISQIQKPNHEIKVLDIGCGNGTFINYMKQKGFEVWGIDIDPKSIEVAKKHFNLQNTFNMSLEEFIRSDIAKENKFDVITFFEVLEHQTNPKEFLENIKKIISKDGIFGGTVPNRNRAFAEITRKNRNYDFPPHHFMWFSKKSLENLFQYSNAESEINIIGIDSQTAVERLLDFLFDISKISIFDRNNLEKRTSKFFSYIITKTIQVLAYPIILIPKLVYNTIGGFGLLFIGKFKS